MRIAAAVLLVLVGGCAAHSFDRHIAAGEWRAAIAAFDSDSALQRNERALYRAALLRASPELDTYDPAAARALFRRLLELHPNSIHRESAIRFIGIIDELERMRFAALARQREIEVERDRLLGEVGRLRRALERADSRLLAQQEEGETLRRTVGRLQADLQLREQRLRTLREELDRLKAIDLRPPGQPATNGDTLPRP